MLPLDLSPLDCKSDSAARSKKLKALSRQRGVRAPRLGVVVLKPDLAVQLFSQLMWNAVVLTAPLLLATLLVGVLVSVLQVVTQIQEMSLTFIPKLLVAVVVLLALGPWMLKRLVTFSASLINSIPQYF